MNRLFAFSLAALSLHHAAAEVSLIVPFADPQPISADVLGVDAAQGRTTWALHQGALTGTWTDVQGSFPGTATLIEGADYASFTYVVAQPEATFTAGGECSLKDGVAVCVAVADGATVTETDSVTAFGIQGGSGGAQEPATPSGSGAAAGSGSGSSAPASTQPSSAVRVTTSVGALAAALFLACYST